MSSVDVVENFVGVYLLRSLSPKYKGWTYIGYTVDPNRRLKQHNRGKKYGGAWRTSKRGPWEMVLTVYGFPNTTSALKFEWAWQHPKKSRRLKFKIKNKQRSESVLNYKIRVLFAALSTPPWNRLPLTVRWISADAIIDAPSNLMPPNHMPVTYGSVISKKVKYPKKSGKVDGNKKPVGEHNVVVKCQICLGYVTEKDLLKCVNINCHGCWHIICIAKKFLADEVRYSVPCTSKLVKRKMNRIIPIEGSCPQCEFFVLWGDLIRKKKGYHIKMKSFSDSSVVVE